MTFAAFQAETHAARLGNRRRRGGVESWPWWGLSFSCCAVFFRAHKNLTGRTSSMAPPRTENPSAFMTASMQGVIRQLRDQEKELERLHKIERERAEHTERLSEEVTRNMPAGLVVVNATGIISSANPAAEQVLGIQTLGFRRYSEVLGEKSDLTRLVGECLTKGSIFRREQVEHEAPGGESRLLGVTISPIRRGDGEDQRSDLFADGFDGAGRVAAADPVEGKSGGGRRVVRGHRA